MIDLREIDETIEELKRRGDSIQAAERLAMLYIAREYMMRESAPEPQGYSQAVAPEPERARTNGGSEFLAACDGSPIEGILGVMDKHMDAILVLYPREYEEIVNRIREL